MKFIDLPVRNQQDFIRTMSVETDIPEFREYVRGYVKENLGKV